MRLVYKFKTYEHVSELTRLCKISKDLYNQALYAVRSAMQKGNFLFYNDLDKLMKETTNLDGECNYRLLKAQVAQQTLKIVDKSVKSYLKSVKDWSKHKDKYKGKPCLPSYKGKNALFFLTYTNQCCTIKQGRLFLNKELSINIPQYDKYAELLETFQQARILPKLDGSFEVELIYLQDIVNNNLDKTRCASIDLGVDNFATMVTDFGRPIIYSGKQIKSKNRYFNKEIARLKSCAEKCNKKKTTKEIRSLYAKREMQMQDVLHKMSKHIVSTLAKNNVGTLICGQNEGWKDSINIGKQNNQTFVQIPYDTFISYLRYKCEMQGISFITTEESYTSKCDALASEEIRKHDEYLGKRVKRGLFQSSIGKLLNADVNGALNIMRKVVGDSENVSRITNSGWLYQPMVLRSVYALRKQ